MSSVKALKQFKMLSWLCAFSLVLISCKTEVLADNSKSDSLPRDFTLTAGETILVGDMNFQFERVESDSRCPKGVQCITAGSAEVIVSYMIDEKPIQKSLKAKSPVTSSDSLHVGDVSITLVFLKPYPAENIRINPAEYQAHFIASKLSSDELEQAKVIDVRTPEEFNSGHYSEASNIPLNTIADNIDSLGFDKDDLIIVYCRSGSRAGKAKAELLSLGYSNVINAANQDVVSQLLKR